MKIFLKTISRLFSLSRTLSTLSCHYDDVLWTSGIDKQNTVEHRRLSLAQHLTIFVS